MTLASGTRLGPYEIVDRLGAGGMGEVYRARDLRLDRLVAVKVLSDRSRGEASARARFDREARAVAALSHPNVVALYDVGEEGDRAYIVSELLVGETLRDRLRRGPISLGEALGIAIQVAEGLVAAHGRGIVHRDLKPANVFLTTDGHAKILDLGLARIETFGGEAPTLREDEQTGEGSIVGTAAYMSPEQVRGDPADTRSDVFSFGSLFRELLTGTSPFERGRTVQTLMAVLQDEPPPLAAIPGLPPRLAALGRTLLSKDAEGRPGMKGVAEELRAVLRETDPEASAKLVHPVHTPGSASGPRWSDSRQETARHPSSAAKRMRRVAAGSILGILAIGGFLYARHRRPQSVPSGASLQPVQLTTTIGLDLFPSFSPDGRRLAWSSNRTGAFEIRLRDLSGGGTESELTTDGGPNLSPTWSPDGKSIAFHAQGRGGIHVAPVAGGERRQVSSFGSRPAWSPDGATIAFQSSPLADFAPNAVGELPPATIWVVPASGGEPHPLTSPGRPSGGHGSPAWSPDSKWVVFGSYDRRKSDLFVVPAGGGEPKLLVEGRRLAFDPAWAPDGSAVYYLQSTESSTRELWRAPVRNGSRDGEPQRISTFTAGGIRHLAVSSGNGRIAYASLDLTSNLHLREVDPRTLAPKGVPRALTNETGRSSRPAFSPDGEWIAFDRWRPGADQDIWIVRRNGSGLLQVTSGGDDDTLPSWYPDGRALAYVSANSGRARVRRIDRETRREEVLLDPGVHLDFARLSPDGLRLAFNSKSDDGVFNVWLAEPGKAGPSRLTDDRQLAAFPAWSPDGKSIAIEIRRGDSVHVATVPSSGGEIRQVTFEEGQSWPFGWSPDGRSVLFAALRGAEWSIAAVRLADGHVERLIDPAPPGIYVRFPILSPQGDLLVFERAETRGNIWELATTP